MCSKLIESKDGLCITRINSVPLLIKNNTRNITSPTDKPEIYFLTDNGVIKTNTPMETELASILTQRDEDDINNKTTIKFPSKFVAETISPEKTNTTDFPPSIKETNIFTAESPSFSTTKTDITSKITSKISPTTEITTPSPLLTEITSENTLLTLPPFRVIEIATKDASSTLSSVTITSQDTISTMSPSSHLTEISFEDRLSSTSSSASEDSIGDVMEFSTLASESNTESKTRKEFAFTVTVGYNNVSEIEKEASTIFASKSSILELNTATNSPKEIISDIESSSTNYSKIVDMKSLHPPDSATDLPTIDLQTLTAVRNHLTSQSLCKFINNI